MWMFVGLFQNQSLLVIVCILSKCRRHGIPSCCCYNKLKQTIGCIWHVPTPRTNTSLTSEAFLLTSCSLPTRVPSSCGSTYSLQEPRFWPPLPWPNTHTLVPWTPPEHYHPTCHQPGKLHFVVIPIYLHQAKLVFGGKIGSGDRRPEWV